MARSAVPLPSIRDIFPEMSMPSNALHPTTKHRAPSANASDPLVVHPGSPSCARPGKSSDALHADTATSYRHSSIPSFSPPSSSASEPSTRPQQNSHLPQSPRHPNSSGCPPSYSFNVLRADPITASLEHVASSTTLRHRGATASSPTSQAGVTNGSAPAFRVAMAPPDQRSSYQRHKLSVQTVMRGTRSPPSPTTAREPDMSHHMRSGHSSMLSFSVSDPPSSASTIMTHDGRRSYLRSTELMATSLSGEGRGKKHQCPHCGKRFNRPSSMKIHVNTHTGAKPYRCPYPGCGREFNVNSNMRRHWRNHSRNGAGRLSDGGDVPNMFDTYPHLSYSPGHGRSPLGPIGQRHALMSPPATNSSLSDSEEEDEEEEAFSDDEVLHPAMDVDGDVMEGLSHERLSVSRQNRTSGESHFPVPNASGWHPEPSEVTPTSARSPCGTSSHPSSAQAHPHSPPSSYVHPDSDSPTTRTECIYKPSLPAYALSCTDTRVSTVLRPAFTQNAPRWGALADARTRST